MPDSPTEEADPEGVSCSGSCAQARAYIEDALDTGSPERAYDLLQKALSVLESPNGAVAMALCELKKAGDYIAESGSELGGGRLHRIADEAADEIRAAEEAPEHVADHMRLYPWEVKLLDPADVPEMHDKTPRAFRTEQAAIMAATRWNDEIYDYVVRPRQTWIAKGVDSAQ